MQVSFPPHPTLDTRASTFAFRLSTLDHRISSLISAYRLSIPDTLHLLSTPDSHLSNSQVHRLAHRSTLDTRAIRPPGLSQAFRHYPTSPLYPTTHTHSIRLPLCPHDQTLTPFDRLHTPAFQVYHRRENSSTEVELKEETRCKRKEKDA